MTLYLQDFYIYPQKIYISHKSECYLMFNSDLMKAKFEVVKDYSNTLTSLLFSRKNS